MTILDSKIETMEAKIRQLKALKQKQEAKARAERNKRSKKEADRRKILVGAALLRRVENGTWTEERLKALMDEFLQKPEERALFGLQPRG